MKKIDKRDRAVIFRDRLAAQMALTNTSRSGLARATGADRSTVAQLLSDGSARLPNAHLAAECARALGVSSDWLLGLTDLPERPGDVLAAAVTVTEAARSSADSQLHDWHREAAGYKIRHVPATLPDMLKTEALLNWEYRHFLGKTPEQAIGASQDRYGLLGEQSSDYEIAVSLGELRAFAAGAGYYEGLDADTRRAQLDHLIATTDALFPSLRLFLYESRRVFSAPVTIFGSFLGVVYIGRFYLAFRSRDRVRSLTEHFDGLVREAEVDAREVPGWLQTLRETVQAA
ncbi:helix-turn-helix transcriptional regulator [Tropicimonas sp. IMCC6043]|uniref:helix-turn-helix domain-containing protein n=1 Tax=Tropicimonas sp. IMCC6043 TaxID=2510645 RepID=UPI00101B8F54|nr:helix-turn-helix transcriptional regulator [Tropicimonas sp. IMCC6043]RYH11537.1 XRE family transcriptional regulator [Tropicimonas sp. IMCC6043]